MISINRRSLVTLMAATAMGLSLAPAKASEFVNILTGGTSGVYYPLGVGLSKIYAEKIDGVRTQVQSTKASVENLNLLQQGKGEEKHGANVWPAGHGVDGFAAARVEPSASG